jgi:hypothetical protein
MYTPVQVRHGLFQIHEHSERDREGSEFQKKQSSSTKNKIAFPNMTVVYNKQPKKQQLEDPRVLMLPELLLHRCSQMQGSGHIDQAWSCSSALQQLAGNLDYDATARLPMHSAVSVLLTVPVSM